MSTFFVYYKVFPMVLDEFIRGDVAISMSKDGVRTCHRMNMPRITIIVKPVSPGKDPERVRNLLNLLQSLSLNGKIIGFSQE